MIGHFQEITGLILNPYSISVSSNNTFFPLLLSTSLDGTIRQWNLDTGSCVYTLSTGSEILGIKWIKDEVFFTFSYETIKLWDLNKFYSTFTFTR